MPFGYSNKVFPRPAVEYIPLLPTALHEVSQNSPVTESQFLIIPSNEHLDKYPFLSQIPEFRLDSEQELGLILINASFQTIKYRGNHVTILIQPTDQNHQVIKILTRYFYKTNLVFQLVDQDGKIHFQKSLSVPTKR